MKTQGSRGTRGLTPPTPNSRKTGHWLGLIIKNVSNSGVFHTQGENYVFSNFSYCDKILFAKGGPWPNAPPPP